MNRYSLEDISLCLTHISKNPRNPRNLREKLRKNSKKLSEDLSEKTSLRKTLREKQQIVP